MPIGVAPLMGLTNVPINAPDEGLKRNTEAVPTSATYKFPSGPMASPCDATRPPVKVSLSAPVIWLYDHTWPAPLLTKMSPCAAGTNAPATSTANAAGNLQEVSNLGKDRKYP